MRRSFVSGGRRSPASAAAAAAHEFVFGAIRTNDVFAVGDEAFASHGDLADGTDEALGVPVSALEGDEPGAAGAGDGLGAGRAPLGKQLAEATGAIRLVFARRKLLASQHGVAIGTHETLPVPSLVFESDSSGGHDLLALCALGGELFLEAADAVDVRLVGDDEWSAAHLVFADDALEALVVPLLALVLHLLHARTEGVATSVAPRSELGVVTRGAKDEGVFGGKRLVHQRGVALFAGEAGLVPVHVLVRHVLGLQADLVAAAPAGVGEVLLVAGQATGTLVRQNVATAR